MDNLNEAVNLSIPARLHLIPREKLRRTAYCKVPVFFETSQFTVKTIDSYDEFIQVMELRHRVFQREFAGKKYCLRSDRDAFDSGADFLVVIDKKTQKIAGTYRLICSLFAKRFYSSTEFDISSLLERDGVKVELSRACILKEYRNGRAISLLWRGLATYMAAVDAKYFFGCGSVQSTDPDDLAAVERQFTDTQVISEDFRFPVRKKYRQSELASGKISEFAIPSLVRAYFKAGAKICSAPAIDRRFKCADYMVLMDTDEINLAYRSKYQSQ